MNKRLIGFIGFLILSFLLLHLFVPSSEAKVKICKPLVWDVKKLEEMKTTLGFKKEKERIIQVADQYLDMAPAIVTNKKKSFAPNKHYYCSIGPYWWPDSGNPNHYTNRDGIVNPESIEFDIEVMDSMLTRCEYFSKAFFLSGDNKYYEAFILQLKAWFIDRDTYMYPNFEYSQVIPGRNNNKGRSTGLISAYGFNKVIESVRLVNRKKMIDKRTIYGLQQWFLAFAKWADEGNFGKALKKANNNIGVAYDVTLANMYLFGGNETRAKGILDSFSENRLNVQILGNGSQPAELKRTNSFRYSMYNLTHIVDMCYFARYWYSNYYQEHRERIDKAFEFLGQYVEKPESFPYQQISDWNKCKQDYYKQLERLKDLEMNNM